MTTNQLVNRVKSILDEYGVSSGNYQDEEIIDALSVGQHSVWSVLATDTVVGGIKHPLLHNLISTDQLTVGVGSNNIIDGIPVRSGIVSLFAAAIYYPLQVIPAMPSSVARWVTISPAEVGRGWRFRDSAAVYYYISGDALWWYALDTTLNSTTPFFIEHIAEPPALSTTQNPTIPADGMLINYATYMLLHKLSKSDVAQIFYNAYLQELSGVRYANAQPNA